MSGIVVIGNAGAGKSTLARLLARKHGIRHIEIDRLLWQPGWTSTPNDIYEGGHREAIAAQGWVIDGLGQRASIPARIARATEIILVDMPLWMHFWLAAERQLKWSSRTLDHPPGAIDAMPPTKALFETMWEVDRTWMPEIRLLCADAERTSKLVTRLTSVEELTRFTEAVG